MSDLKAAKDNHEVATARLSVAIKAAINEALTETFSDPSVETVAWGVSNQEYNDENAGEGVFGPVVNLVDKGAEWDRDAEYSLFYARSTKGADALKKVLDTAGYEAVAVALNLHDEQVAYIATRKGDGFTLYSESIGY